jgi:hypothetical protein
MTNEPKEGPEFREIPSQRQQVCGDCKYHKKDRMMCGHDYVTDNYSCIHPDVISEKPFINILGEGRSIAFNSRETPPTPGWCPFLTSNKKLHE